MSRHASYLIASVALCMLGACASRPAISPAATLAQTSTLRGAQAFARGDLISAQREYTTALQIHESLGDTPERAATLLSLARVASQAGRGAEALAAVNKVLADQSQLDGSTAITANGRAAALYLAQGDTSKADSHLMQAINACAGTCADAGALAVLRARMALVQQQPAQAHKLAADALAMPGLASVTPPTLRPQASAERANALRVQAQALSVLGQHDAAVVAAGAALELDRPLGLSQRVLLDLQLLANAHKARGATAMAQQYQALADRAQAAGQALRSEVQAD